MSSLHLNSRHLLTLWFLMFCSNSISLVLAAPCISSCSDEFVTRCVPFNGNGCTGYNRCSQQITAGTGPLKNRGGCISGCTYTSEMNGICPSGGNGAGNGPNGNSSPAPKAKPSGNTVTSTTTAAPPSEQPIVPTLCTTANKGNCDCATGIAGMKTYTFWIRYLEKTYAVGDDINPTSSIVKTEQRCFTVYIPPKNLLPLEDSDVPLLPVLLHANGYAKDKLNQLDFAPNSKLIKASQRFGFATIGISSPGGSWEFGNNGVVNKDNYPTPCSISDSKEISYIKGILEFIGGKTGSESDSESNANKFFKPGHVYIEGFSVNSMFSVYVGVCFRDYITGIWQGGSGIARKGIQPYTPDFQAQCSNSAFKRGRNQCVNNEPCDNCEYWPIYPTTTTISQPKKIRDCIASYTDDFLHGTSKPMYDIMLTENHDPRLLQFSPVATLSAIPNRGGGHNNPENSYAWMVGCLGIVGPSCSSQCEIALESCMNSSSFIPASTVTAIDGFYTCLDSTFSNPSNNCTTSGTNNINIKSCSPTLRMLKLSEIPELVLLSGGEFGASGGSSGGNEGTGGNGSGNAGTINVEGNMGYKFFLMKKQGKLLFNIS